tara:strand:- start:3397 stop:3723 length:327 start_codon:yes stop_codon:yes gene_type:complete
MKATEELYIKVELGLAKYSELGQAAESDILDEGIDCADYEVYEIIYENGVDSVELLKKVLDCGPGGLSMLYPLECYDYLSYEGYMEYKEEADEEAAYLASLKENEGGA